MKRRIKRNGSPKPLTLRPRKKYAFRTPIPPRSVVRVKVVPRNPWRKEIGRRFRTGYYSRKDGLDCIWLVDEEGSYEQTIDHEFLNKFFEIESISKERTFYGSGRQRLRPARGT
jgi:hypothetical protein